MKILAFVDVHANELVLKTLGRKAADADLLICAGDISVFGRGLEETLAVMDSWGKPLLIIHGNHEDEDEMRELVEATKNIRWAHATEHEIAGLSIVGWGGGGFAHTDSALERFAAQLEPKPGRIMIFHGPPLETAIDVAWAGEHVGCATRRAVIERLQPAVAIAGHIHECFGEHSMIGKSLVMNPGPLGVFLELKAAAKQEKTKKAAKKGGKKK
jgi:Icc-related predicted phosphoesterase